MKKFSVLLILSILAAILITGCNYASAPSVEPSAEAAVENSAPVTEQEPGETANIENLAPVTKPADTSEPPVTEPVGEGASSPSMPPAQPENEPPAQQEPTTEDELCGYPLAQPVTTAFEMYMQYYDEKGNIIEIPQILDDSPTAEAINRELREIGDEYYREYIDGFVGNHTCQVIAYPCETEEYLSIVLVEKELPEDRDNDGDVESWVYDRKTQAQLMVDVGFDPETIEAAMTPGMKFDEIEDIEYRHVDNGNGEYYITVEYSIDGREYEGLFIMRDGRLTQYLGGPIMPSYAVANFAEPLWAQWEENHNRLYDTFVSDEELSQVGDKMKELAIKHLDLLLEPEQLKAVYLGTGDMEGDNGIEPSLIFQIVTVDERNSYGIFHYGEESGGYYAAQVVTGEPGRIDQ